MPDNCVQCALSPGANCVHRLASSSRALSSSALQVPGATAITSDAPLQLEAISKFGTPPAAPCGCDVPGRVPAPGGPRTSAEIFAQAAIRGVLCGPRVRHEA